MNLNELTNEVLKGKQISKSDTNSLFLNYVKTRTKSAGTFVRINLIFVPLSTRKAETALKTASFARSQPITIPVPSPILCFPRKNS